MDATGEHADIVLSTPSPPGAERGGLRVSRARAGRRAACASWRRCATRWQSMPGAQEAVLVRVDELGRTDRLSAARAASGEQGAGGAGRAASAAQRRGGSRRTRLGVMVNEEDHLRLQALRSGLRARARLRRRATVGQRARAACPFCVPSRVRISHRLSDERRDGAAGVGADPSAGARADEGDRPGAGRASADGADVPRLVRRGERGGRELLPDFEPDDARAIRGGSARSAVARRAAT